MRPILTVAVLVTLPLCAQGIQSLGSGTLTFVFQNIDHRAVILKDGSKAPGGRAYNRTISAELNLALTNRLSVSVGTPYVFGKYTDPVNPPDPISSRDGCKCLLSNWQDFSLSARYNIYDSRRWSVTPSISVGIPSYNYDYIGLNVPGRHLKELTLSTEVWRRLLRRTSVSGRYSYTFVEKALGKSTNRSNLVLQGNYDLRRDKLSVFGIGLLQRTHGGLRAIPLNSEEFLEEYPTGQMGELFAHRNRLFRDNHFRVGGGVTYALGHMTVVGTMIIHVTGRNTHKENILTVGVRYPFNWRSETRPSNR